MERLRITMTVMVPSAALSINDVQDLMDRALGDTLEVRQVRVEGIAVADAEDEARRRREEEDEDND